MEPTHAAGALTLPESLASYLVIGWMIGATLGPLSYCLWLVSVAVPARHLHAGCGRKDSIRHCGQVLSEIQPRRSVKLCVSDAVRVPAAIGYFRPFVVFPSWALARNSDARTEMPYFCMSWNTCAAMTTGQTWRKSW